MIELKEQHNNELIMLERDLETQLKFKEDTLMEKLENAYSQIKELQQIQKNLYSDNEILKRGNDKLQRYYFLMAKRVNFFFKLKYRIILVLEGL